VDLYRLPRTVVPTRYDLRLEPDLTAATFTGHVAIAVTIHEAVTEVLLNAAELAIHSATLEAGPDNHLATIALDEAAERCRLTFPRPLAPGPARLLLSFTGTLNDKLRGLYRSRYKDAAGEWRTLAATQFEATDARRAFPCWDEPAFKAVFSATLVVPLGLVALSNTAIAEEYMDSGKRVVRFADTIPMSTYLVAFVVGELEASDPVIIGRTPLRVWCVPGKRHLAGLGQQIGAFSLHYFEEYYGREYPGDKLDLIAIPDFAAGAMENLGAITFRETALLVDEATATHQEKERVADVVAHENAHMWFGDLVTMRWWNGLWLNEAFATFMEMLAVDAWRPHWQRWTTFGVSRSAALTVDGLQSTRPIEYPVAAPADADAMFDVLTYEKGASVLRMLEQYIGPDVFRAGVRDYLARHAYANTETADLWHSLAGPSGLPIPAILDGWVFRPGYPLVSARRQDNHLVLHQQRFTYLPSAPGDAHAASRWQVPVQLRLYAGGRTDVLRVLLTETEACLPIPPDTDAVLVNEGGHGFYRVRYEGPLLEALLAKLPNGLTAIERFNLINDSWAAVLGGLMPLKEYLDLTVRFQGDRDRNVWAVLLSSFAALDRIIDADDRPGLSALVRARLRPAVTELGWSPRPGEDELIGQLRADLLRAIGTLGDDRAAQTEAERVFNAGGAVAEVQAAAVAIVAHIGDAARYEDFVRRYRAARTPQEEQRYLLALAGFRPPPLVERTLQMALSSEVRTQDGPFLVRAALFGPHSRERAWAFVRPNWERMSRDYPVMGLRRMCEGVLGLARAEWEREVRAFFAEKQVSLGGKVLDQYLEQLHLNVQLREREGEALRAYLRSALGA
jgi:puromycin-sensitive aminopeptidase